MATEVNVEQTVDRMNTLFENLDQDVGSNPNIFSEMEDDDKDKYKDEEDDKDKEKRRAKQKEKDDEDDEYDDPDDGEDHNNESLTTNVQNPIVASLFCINHHAITESQRFCGKCGVKLIEDILKCEHCGADISPQDEFCPQCGKQINDEARDTPHDKAEEREGYDRAMRGESRNIPSKFSTSFQSMFRENLRRIAGH